MRTIDDAPGELALAIREFWLPDQWDAAASISYLESAYDAFAVRDTRSSGNPCGSVIDTINGVAISAELSVGYFQLNACNFPRWEWQRFYNARHNAGTAHLLYVQAGGWSPWYFSASKLGLI